MDEMTLRIRGDHGSPLVSFAWLGLSVAFNAGGAATPGGDSVIARAPVRLESSAALAPGGAADSSSRSSSSGGGGGCFTLTVTTQGCMVIDHLVVSGEDDEDLSGLFPHMPTLGAFSSPGSKQPPLRSASAAPSTFTPSPAPPSSFGNASAAASCHSLS